MTEDQREKEFCEKLTALLLEYGFGIADEPHIYNLVSPEDDPIDVAIENSRTVSIDDESRLHFV